MPLKAFSFNWMKRVVTILSFFTVFVFITEGPACNITLENGDSQDLNSTKLNQRNAFNGKCLMILQSKNEAGKLTIEVSSDGLEATVLTLEIRKQ